LAASSCPRARGRPCRARSATASPRFRRSATGCHSGSFPGGALYFLSRISIRKQRGATEARRNATPMTPSSTAGQVCCSDWHWGPATGTSKNTRVHPIVRSVARLPSPKVHLVFLVQQHTACMKPLKVIDSLGAPPPVAEVRRLRRGAASPRQPGGRRAGPLRGAQRGADARHPRPRRHAS
jgi:hypothetical protein